MIHWPGVSADGSRNTYLRTPNHRRKHIRQAHEHVPAHTKPQTQAHQAGSRTHNCKKIINATTKRTNGYSSTTEGKVQQTCKTNHAHDGATLSLFWIRDVFWLGPPALRCWDPISKRISNSNFGNIVFRKQGSGGWEGGCYTVRLDAHLQQLVVHKAVIPGYSVVHKAAIPGDGVFPKLTGDVGLRRVRACVCGLQKIKSRQNGVRRLCAGFETWFGSEPRHLSVLGSDSKPVLKSS